MSCPLAVSAGSSITLTTSASSTTVKAACQYGTAKVVDITGYKDNCRADSSGHMGCYFYADDVKSITCDKSDMELVLSASASFSNLSGSALLMFDDDEPFFSRGLLNSSLHIFYSQPTVTCFGGTAKDCLPPGTSIRNLTGNLLNSSCVKYELETTNVPTPSPTYRSIGDETFGWGAPPTGSSSLDGAAAAGAVGAVAAGATGAVAAGTGLVICFWILMFLLPCICIVGCIYCCFKKHNQTVVLSQSMPTVVASGNGKEDESQSSSLTSVKATPIY